jgi:hypothetical protein
MDFHLYLDDSSINMDVNSLIVLVKIAFCVA